MNRKELVIELRSYWINEITELDSNNGYYYPKVLLKHNGIEGITIFPSELKLGKFFTEFVNYSYKPITNPRSLYYIEFTQQLLTFNQYPKIDTKIGEQFFIPFTDLINVGKVLKNTNEPIQSTMESYLVDNDCNLDDLTARDWACIHLKVPKSERQWLNELIVESRNKS